MKIEDRIKRIEQAIKFEQEQMHWLREHEWGQSDKGPARLKENWEAVELSHDRTISMYQDILDALKDERDANRT